MTGKCAGIVTYNPELQRLRENIVSIYDQVEQVVIVDNNSNNTEEIVALISGFKKMHIIRNEKNVGIAKALNQICQYAIETGFKWCLTLDQDSVSPNGLIEFLEEYAASNVAIVAPNIIYRNNESFAQKKEGTEEVEWVITSASLTNLSVWRQIGGFDEQLFIDGVDRDYCIRAKRAGYKIIKNYNIELLHELGDLKCTRFCGKVIHVTNHSSTRRYYMARNVIYLDRKLGEKRAVRYILQNIVKIILFEKQKVEKLNAINHGIRDSRRMQVR